MFFNISEPVMLFKVSSENREYSVDSLPFSLHLYCSWYYKLQVLEIIRILDINSTQKLKLLHHEV